MSESIFPEGGDNLYLASLANEAFYIFSLLSEGDFQPNEQHLSYIQKIRDYLAWAREGRDIESRWETEGTIPISTKTVKALDTYKETCNRLGGWDDSTISKIESILRRIEDPKKIEQEDSPETLQFAADFFRNLSEGALRNPIHNPCEEIF